MATTALIPHDVLVGGGTKFLSPETEPGSPGDILPRQQHNLTIIQIAFQPGGAYSALPSRVLFGALRHPALKLREPIPVRTERSERGISVIWDEGQEFGFGDTFGDAIADFGGTIAELYLNLCENEALSGDLIAVRDKLSHYIDVRPQ